MKKILTISSFFAIIAGIILVIGGVWGIFFTYKNITQEKIVTPADATISQQPVRGPFTLKAQADIIRKHVLATTGGKTYAEMSREDANRNLWITATTLTTALNLGILTYVFSGLILLFGCVSIWTGVIFYALRSRKNNFA
ncbi:MAG: hypothetical protein HZA80_03295 [Candidatus Taylorbacteria bacterium]|nr:hypothetical protein [Candidatus Taylorbacteria bacterium]